MEAQAKKDKIIKRALIDASANGWSKQALSDAAMQEGFEPLMAEALFPTLKDATAYVSEYFDRQLMDQLGIADNNMRTRDKIAHAVMTRLDLMAPYRDGLKSVMAARLQLRGAKTLWRTADQIWIWAGDTATDYNRYTKRGLLSGVILSTTLFWFNDTSPGFRATSTFLDRRISNILNVGKMIGMAKQYVTRKRA